MKTSALAFVSIASTVLIAGSPEPLGKEVVPEMTEVREIRAVALASAEEGSFTMPKDQPGLHIGFEISVPGADGNATILKLEQPETVTASDSAGADLSNIEPGFGDQKTYIEQNHKWEDDDADTFTLHLSEPRRQAESFSVDTTFDAVVYDTTSTHTMNLPASATSLPAEVAEAVGLGDVQVEFIAKEGGGDLKFTPGSAYERFEKVRIFGNGSEMEQSWAMWNDMSASVTFTGEQPAGAKIELIVREGLRSVPVRVSVVDRPLP